MFNNMFFYLFICLLFFGIGDFLSVLTKAKVSSVFVSLLLFLIAFITGIIPPDIIKQAGLADFGKWAILFIVFSLGTTINLRELIDEWRTLAVSFIAMALVVVTGFALIPVIGKNEALVTIPIVNGGIVATQIMTTAALEHGFALAAALGTIVYAVQKFFGTPFASHFGIKEAETVVADFRKTGMNKYKKEAPKKEDGTLSNPNFFERNKKYYGVFVSLAITALFAWLSFVIGKMTHISAPGFASRCHRDFSGARAEEHPASREVAWYFQCGLLRDDYSESRNDQAFAAPGAWRQYAHHFRGRLCRALSRFLASSVLEDSGVEEYGACGFCLPAARLPGDLSDRERSRQSGR